ncbi:MULTISPECIES: hypothetical protein [Bacteroidales]|uniref:hypothetical protein n=1 Tax=Bacteroidales TaxID=171549 RepID=UPI002106A2E7|nr:hypothetical protein [Butyricimonas hominis]
MNVIIEHIFCQYSDEATALYLRIINVILMSSNEAELRASMEKLKHTSKLDEYFIYGFGKHHIWVCLRKPSDRNKIFEHRVLMVQF